MNKANIANTDTEDLQKQSVKPAKLKQVIIYLVSLLMVVLECTMIVFVIMAILVIMFIYGGLFAVMLPH